MAEIEVKKTDEVKTTETPKRIFKIVPYYTWDYDCENSRLEYEISLAGVPKENIKLKVLPTMFHLEAKRVEETSEGHFSLTKYFMDEVDPKSAEAKYDNGLLRFSVKLKNPMDDAIEIKL